MSKSLLCVSSYPNFTDINTFVKHLQASDASATCKASYTKRYLIVLPRISIFSSSVTENHDNPVIIIQRNYTQA